MPKNPRVHELAKELGVTNQQVLDLCGDLGIGVKTHSSSVVEAQADRVRRKAKQLGLKAPEGWVEPAKKSSAKKKAEEVATPDVAAVTGPRLVPATSPPPPRPERPAPAADRPAAAAVAPSAPPAPPVERPAPERPAPPAADRPAAAATAPAPADTPSTSDAPGTIRPRMPSAPA